MLPKISYFNNKGFTLIETLISIVILGILSAIAVPSFMAGVNNKRVEEVATSIEGALKEAQSTAGRRNRSCSILITTTSASAVDAGCLPSGTRQIQDSGSNIEIAGTGGSGGTTVTFTSTGATLASNNLVIYRTDAVNVGLRKCILISAGVGIIKNGTYTGTLSAPPTTTEVSSATACSAK
jgi:prepilin-type N-terminal cleavage/methylation domain-containing protein